MGFKARLGLMVCSRNKYIKSSQASRSMKINELILERDNEGGEVREEDNDKMK